MRSSIRRCRRENDKQTARLFAAVSRNKFRLCGCEPLQIPPLEMLQFGDRRRNGGFQQLSQHYLAYECFAVSHPCETSGIRALLAPHDKEFLFRNDIKNTQCEFCEGGSNKLRFYCFCKVCENGKA